MVVTNQNIIDFLLANPGMTDAQIAATMQEFNVTPFQLAQAVNADPNTIQSRYLEAAPNVYTSENVNKLASQILAQNTTEKWTGGLPPEKAALYMADELAKSGVSDIAQVGKGNDGIINKMTGKKLISGYGERTGGNLWSGSYEGKGNTGFGVEFDDKGNPVFYTQGASSSTLGKDLLKLAVIGGAAYGLGGFEGLFGGGAGTAAGTTGLTTAELAQLDLALGGAGGTAGAESLAAALATGAPVATLTNLTGGSGLLTGEAGGITAQSVADKLAADAALNPTAITAGGGGGGTPPPTTTTPPPTTTTPPPTTTPTGLMNGLTNDQMLNLAKAGLTLASTVGVTNALTPDKVSATPMSIPTQGVPLNTEDYYKAIQQNYNSLLPSMPRDVSTPLMNWYNSKYGS